MQIIYRSTNTALLISDNIAINKAAFQSSTFAAGSTADKAVDGNKNPDYGGNSCAATRQESLQWWIVDLQKQHDITAVRLTKRSDTLGECRIQGGGFQFNLF